MQALHRELGDIGYGVLCSDLLNFETGLHQELKRLYELIVAITPEPELINLLRLRYDFHNLTAGYKAKYFSEWAELALSDLGVVDKEQLMQIMEQDDLGRLPPCLSRIAAQVVAELGTSPEGATVDMAFDKALYSFLYQEAVKHKSLFLQGLFQ